jgi:hypothetical protein
MEEYHMYYDRQLRPISRDEFPGVLEQERHVDYTDLGKLGRVSTVFLALNHAFRPGPPILFETMIFGGPMDQYMDRYYTEEEARKGHAFAVQALMFYKPEGARPLLHNGGKPRR